MKNRETGWLGKNTQLEVRRARIPHSVPVGHHWAILPHSKGWQYMTHEGFFFLWLNMDELLPWMYYDWLLSFSEALITNVCVLNLDCFVCSSKFYFLIFKIIVDLQFCGHIYICPFLYMFFFIFFSIMVYPRRLDIVPCVIL